jgi:hypothetical protein
MNQLVNDLAEHADFYVGNEHSDKSHEEKQRIFMEHFTLLVIEEATRALNPMLRDMISRGQAVSLIKQHFSVGEEN